MVFLVMVSIFAVLGVLLFIANRVAIWHYNINPDQHDDVEHLKAIYYVAAVVIWISLVKQFQYSYGNTLF